MAKAVKYLYANYQAPDKLYVGSSFMFFNLKYYLSQNSPVAFVATSANQTETIKPWLYSGGVTEVRAMPHYAGTALLTNNDLLPDLNRNLKSGNKVWLVWTNGFGAEKPKVPLAWQAISQQEFPEVRPYLGTSVFVSEYQVKE
jgi:hypothetical protein